MKLYRGDSTNIERFQLSRCESMFSLFGIGLYLTSDPVVARDYTTKGAADVVFEPDVDDPITDERRLVAAYLKEIIDTETDWKEKAGGIIATHRERYLQLPTEEFVKADVRKLEEDIRVELKKAATPYLKKAKALFRERKDGLEAHRDTFGHLSIMRKGRPAVISEFDIPEVYASNVIAGDEPLTDEQIELVRKVWIQHYPFIDRCDMRNLDGEMVGFDKWVEEYRTRGVRYAWDEEGLVVGGKGENPDFDSFVHGTHAGSFYCGREWQERFMETFQEAGYVGMRYQGGRRIAQRILGGAATMHDAPITGGSCTGSTPSLEACGFLTPGFVNVNSYNQTHRLTVRRAAPNILEAYVSTDGGMEIPAAALPRVASLVGASAGFVATTDIPGCPTGAACGSFGGWQVPNVSSVIPSAVQGHLVSTLAFNGGALLTDYLYRNEVPGHPEANTMFTDLHMDGAGTRNDITGAGEVEADLFTANVDVVTPEVTLSSMNNQKVTQAIYYSGIHTPGDVVTKPACPSAQRPEVYVTPASFAANNTGQTMSSVQAYATDAGAGWAVNIRVRTQNGWMNPSGNYARLLVLTKCSD